MTHWIKKFNPYHDEAGRFSSADGAGTGDGSYRLISMDSVRSNPELFQIAVNSVGDAITPPHSLTLAQQNALMNYADRGFYERINRPLRHGVGVTEMHDAINPYTNSAMVAGTMSTQEVVDSLDSAIAANTLPENLTLFRGLNNWPKAFGVDSEDKLVGLTFQDKGFVSTTIEKAKAVEFGSFVKDKFDTVVQIQAPKGMHAVAMVPNFTDEEEVILPRGSQFKVTSVEHDTVSDTHGFQHNVRKIMVTPIHISKSDVEWVTLAKASGDGRYTWNEGDIQVMVNKDAGVAGDNDVPASPAINGPGFSWRKLPEQVQTHKKRKLAKYAESQPRDDNGRFASGGSSVKELFADNLGIKRADMPQIPNGPMKDKFMAELKDEGIKVEKETVQATSLKPTQSEYNEENIAHLRKEYDAGRVDGNANPIVVSNDHRILDGHHRWALMAEKGLPIETIKVGMPIKDLLARAAKFNTENSIKARTKDTIDFKKSDYLDLFESMETVLKDDPSGNDPTQLYSAAGRPKWMQSPGQGGVDPVYRSQKPGQGGNQDTSFSKNINENPPTVIPVDADGYYIW